MFKNIRWLWLLVGFWAGIALAADNGLVQKRWALVIGNDRYEAILPLSNAVADARAMAVNLDKLGFEVLLATNANRNTMLDALRKFKERIGEDDEAFFYFSGHGVQLAASNYLLPIDVAGDNEDLIRENALDLQQVLKEAKSQKARFTLAVIDACRNNPFRSGNGRSIGGRGLGMALPANGQMVIYSAGTGQEAMDKLGKADKDPNGVFTRVFLREMMKPNVPISQVLHNVRDEVLYLTRGVQYEQMPASFEQAPGQFFFSRAREVAPVPVPSSNPIQISEENQAQWQAEMQASFDEAAALDATPALQLAAWQRFLTVFAPDNPYSKEDEALRAQATARKDALEQQILATHLPDVTRDAAAE